MSDIEVNLLLLMTTPEGINEVADTRMRGAVFEEPIHYAVFEFAMRHWAKHQKPPTMAMFAAEYPGLSFLKQSPADVEETADWLIERLQKRFITNKAQQLLMEAAETCNDDPAGSLRQLHKNTGEVIEQVGRTGDHTHLRDLLIHSVEDLMALLPVEPLIDKLLYRNTLAQLSGPPGCFKSFLAIALCCSLALGRDLGPFRVSRPGVVVYVAAEGAEGLKPRLMAWCEAHRADPAEVLKRLHILPAPIQLDEENSDVAEIIEVINEVEADLVVLDTRARCTVGLDENSATQQGAAIEAAEKIRRARQCTALALHHTPRSGNAGRGSNAWDGAVWSDLRMTRDGLTAKVHCEKHKDASSGCDHQFGFVEHTVSESLMPGHEEDQRTTLVLSRFGKAAGTFDLGPHSKRAVLEVIRKSAPPEGLSRPEIIDIAKGVNVGKTAAYEAINSLFQEGRIQNVGSEKRHRYVAAEGDE
ncbi:MAG: AAA family ATPase [Candidatus Sericytochromatia bacterium]